MDKKQAENIIKHITYAYIGFIPTDTERAKEKVRFWISALSNLDYDIATNNLNNYIKTNSFPPTIADLSGTTKKTSYADYEQRQYGEDVFNQIENLYLENVV